MKYTYDALPLQDQTRDSYTLGHYYLDNLHERDFLIFDLESTGFDYTAEEIIEVAALPIGNLCVRQELGWSSFIRNTKDIPDIVRTITGITNEDTQGGLPLADVLKMLVTEYPEHTWVAQCGFEFDFPFLDQEYRRLFRNALPVEVLDTKVLFAAIHPDTEQTISTDFLMHRYGIDAGARIRHRANGDAALLAEIFLRIMQEYTNLGKDEVVIDTPLLVRKFVLPGA